MNSLKLGVAYHGNRMLRQVQNDMLDILNHNMNLVVHMFTHNDMERHKEVMKDIISATKDLGLECWVDNWGLGGPPGDLSHVLQFYRDSHQVNNKGEIDPIRICFNSHGYLEFVKSWIDMVAEAGGDTLFWDEPHLINSEDGTEYSCCCDRCKKLFEEKYNKPMPSILTPEVEEFRYETMAAFFAEVTSYAAAANLKNVACLHVEKWDFAKSLAELDSVDGIGTDPYWSRKEVDVYDLVYGKSRDCMKLAEETNCTGHIWVKGYGLKDGMENDIFNAAEAAYDAGARTILSWSYRGGEACDYRMQHTDLGWHITGEAMRRIRDKHINNVVSQKRASLGIK